MRTTSLIAIALLTVTATGCGLPSLTPPTGQARPTASARGSSPVTPSTSPVATGLTIADAKRGAANWLAEHNRTVKDRDWWDDPSAIDKLFWDGTRHEAVIDRWAVKDGDRRKEREPIRLTGQVSYVPREQTIPGGQWFLLQATYAGRDRPHILAFWRPEGGEFKLAAKSPLHHGQRVPEPRRDAEGYVTAMPARVGREIAQEYLVFWDYDRHDQEGRDGYRLAEDNHSRRAYRTVSKGAYIGYQSYSRPYGFRTADGGSFHVFSLLNDPQSISAVLTLGVATRGKGKALHEIAADWYA
ncbi:hypothetical protein E1292_45235 [Nonomuraea deserti]|uniref:DUF8094 domain-containing protein n=1 Tax=Nonomuraea deserti TaxID=1848322 RepID=A0A4R4UBZ8_9ACTN|nr:hypothetical protein [Nonomuraea deserti]TDC88760.1 hypothetical protein E1292_45235 [Nonomuraea deserti]